MRVIPANAGVILYGFKKNNDTKDYPRECGGDPEKWIECYDIVSLSPRMRG